MVDLGELIRVALAAAYAVFGLALICFGGRPSNFRVVLIVTAFMSSAVALFHTLATKIAPWPAGMALVFVVVLIHGAMMYRRGDFDN
jgi:hypothetical protein